MRNTDKRLGSQTDDILDELDERWLSVQKRAAVADGQFVYAVKSTGVYCRPNCPSRRPASRSAVEFFATADEAEAAGYRACLRCGPSMPGAWRADLERLQAACRIIERDADNGSAATNLETLAGQLSAVSPSHLRKCFKRILGISPRQYADAVRLRRFRAMLHDGLQVGHAVRDSGFGASANLYGRRELNFGVPPAEYRAGSPGVEISYAITQWPLGQLLVAATANGVCSIKMGDSEQDLLESLKKEFPKAVLKESPESLGPYILAAVSVMGNDINAADRVQHLPLDIKTTAFKWKVWLALRDLEPGARVTYSQLAGMVNSPGAARAVGTACATNPVALAIPCHRVVHADDSLSRYGWGVTRKEILLRHEAGFVTEELE